MKRHIQTTAIFIILGAATFLGCQSMYLQPGEDGNGFLETGETRSSFQAIQIDPRAEDSAGPQFAAVGDFNNDGMVDIVSGWNESQPVQIHLQQETDDGDIAFATLPVGGTTPVARAAGLKVADLDQDGFDDIVVLVKDTGLIAQCDLSREDCDITENGGYIDGALAGAIVVFFNPQDVLAEPWLGITLTQSMLAGTDEGALPEEGGYTGLDVGDIDGTNGPDIVVALNSAEGLTLDADPPPNTISLYPNPGGGTARNPEGWSRLIIHADRPAVSACRITDVDEDGDNDVVATYPPAMNANVRWLPNPLSLGPDGNVYDYWPPHAPIGQVATSANVLDVGDIDGDGLEDVLVRSTDGKIVQWFKKPASPSQTFIRNPWQVYSLAEFTSRAPGAIALGDLTGDGELNAVVSAEGAVAWFARFGQSDNDVYDLWQENLIIDDTPTDATTDIGTAGLLTLLTDPHADPEALTGTFINALLVTDVDGDGFNDIIATLDRGALSGLSNDALALFRNTLGD